MSGKVKIPSGWRRLTSGLTGAGDKGWDERLKAWVRIEGGWFLDRFDGPVIRRRTPSGRKGAK